MSLLKKIMNQVIEQKPELASLQIVVEKELLHHDILRIMRDHNLMEGLTFIGGTCLRACYGSMRLSEDLDFTGGAEFSREQLANLAKVLIDNLQDKYGLQVTVSEPIKDKQNVDTWKIKVETRQSNKSLQAQRINIDICSVPSYEPRSMTFLNLYDVDMGTSGMVIQAQSLPEIYADKLLAFAFRPNRIKHRDLWDILWLHSKNIVPNFLLISKKLQDRNLTMAQFVTAFDDRLDQIEQDATLVDEFVQEMSRFLSQDNLKHIAQSQHQTWQAIVNVLQDLRQQIKNI